MASRSLGTLTVDLVARTGGFVQGMDKGSKEAEKFRRKVKKDLEVVGQAFKLASAAAVAGLTAITVETARSADQVSRFSKLAGSSTREFQRYAAGARAVGIEQEKFADILKDVNDKVGDFLQTGGGPLADFFENIAPKVGVTAEQFRNLSGPQALELYVSSLEQANLSQSEMTFFLEAIANDASLLIPLLQDGGRGFKEFGDQAERAGAIMDEKTLAAANRLKAETFLLEQNLRGIRIAIGQEVIPILSDLAEAFVNADANTEGLNDSLYNELGEALRFIVSRAAAAAGAIELVGKSIGGLAAIWTALGRQEGEGFFSTAPLDRAKNVAKELTADLDAVAQRYASLIRTLEGGGDGAGRNSVINDILNNSGGGAGGSRDRQSGLEEIVVPDRSLSRTNDAGAEAAAVRERIRFIDEAAQEYEKIQEERRAREIEQAQEHEDWLTDIKMAGENARLKAAEDAVTGFSTLARSFADEQSALYQAAFAVEKAAAIARSIVAIQTAIAQASASGPFPANLAAIAQVAAATAGIISTIQSTSIQGQAHDGLMSVPKTGTYLLEKGERVTTAETSAKLDKTLDQMQGGGGVRIINTVDPNIVGDYMGSSQGERVIMNTIRKNQRTVQALATA